MTLRDSIKRALTGSSATSVAQSSIPVDAILTEVNSDRQLQIMLDEIADLTKAMRELLLTLDRYVYFGGLLAAGAFTLGVIHNKDGLDWLALVVAPYGIGLSFIYLIQVFTEIERRAGYKQFLEEQIRQRLHMPVFLYSDINSWGARNRPSNWGAMLINGAGLFIFSFFGVLQTRRYDLRGPSILGLHVLNLHYLNILALVGLGAVLIAAMSENFRESGRAYRVAHVTYDRYFRMAESGSNDGPNDHSDTEPPSQQAATV